MLSSDSSQAAGEHDHNHHHEHPAVEQSSAATAPASIAPGGKAFASATDGLPDALPVTVVGLDAGDNQEITAAYVKKRS